MFTFKLNEIKIGKKYFHFQTFYQNNLCLLYIKFCWTTCAFAFTKVMTFKKLFEIAFRYHGYTSILFRKRFVTIFTRCDFISWSYHEEECKIIYMFYQLFLKMIYYKTTVYCTIIYTNIWSDEIRLCFKWFVNNWSFKNKTFLRTMISW